MYEKFWRATGIACYWNPKKMTVGEYVTTLRPYLLRLRQECSSFNELFAIFRRKAVPLNIDDPDVFANTILKALPKNLRYINENSFDMKPNLNSTCGIPFSITISNKLKGESITLDVTTGGIYDDRSLVIIDCFDESINLNEKMNIFKISIEYWSALEGRMGVQSFNRDVPTDFDHVYIGWTTFIRSPAVMNCMPSKFDVEPFDGGALIRIHGDMPSQADEDSLSAVAAVRECLEQAGVSRRAALRAPESVKLH